MEDLLVDQEKQIVVEPGTTLTGTSKQDWEKIDKKAQSTIQLFLVDSVMLNASREDTTKKLWDKLGNL